MAEKHRSDDEAIRSDKSDLITSRGSKSDLVRRKLSLLNMSSVIRNMKVRDKLEAMDYLYTDSSDWTQTFPEAAGTNQSPIDINSSVALYDETLSAHPLQFDYAPSRETEITNNGQTLVVIPRNDRAAVSGGPLPLGEVYEVADIKFHWGSDENQGSEHTVNQKAFPLEFHITHYNKTRYNSYDEALGQVHGVAAVAVIVQIGHEHGGIKQITEHLDAVRFKGRQKVIQNAISPSVFLPDEMLRDYWTYPGSLTLPPCTEQVTWVVLRYPLTIGKEQMDEFRKLRNHHKNENAVTSNGGKLADNFRAVQPINGRTITASFPQ